MKEHSFAGCSTCRFLKKKCDLGRPQCGLCLKSNIPCAGYAIDLIWPNEQGRVARTRRLTDGSLTWDQARILRLDEVDRILKRIDESLEPFSAAAVTPFTVFNARIQHGGRFSRSSNQIILSANLSSRYEENNLLQHYVNHVSKLMMPYDSEVNPWRYDYPSVGTKATYLRAALLAHSATHLANVHFQPSSKAAIRHYTHAVESVRRMLDKLDERNHSKVLAAVLTLMMTEVYGGDASGWLSHLAGARQLSQSVSPGLHPTRFETASLQSLYIIQTIWKTTALPGTMLERFVIETLQRPINIGHDKSPPFGFTIGASADILNIIADATDLYLQGERDEIALGKFRFQLAQSRAVAWKKSSVPSCELYQQRAFISATEIYLHQSFQKGRPCQIQELFQQTFDCVSSFFDFGGGNLSLWPAFIASVEAYTTAQQKLAKEWMEKSLKVGMKNRDRISGIIEEVWNRRRILATATGTDQGDVFIDWRLVMHELGANVLLV